MQYSCSCLICQQECLLELSDPLLKEIPASQVRETSPDLGHRAETTNIPQDIFCTDSLPLTELLHTGERSQLPAPHLQPSAYRHIILKVQSKHTAMDTDKPHLYFSSHSVQCLLFLLSKSAAVNCCSLENCSMRSNSLFILAFVPMSANS